MNEIQREIKRYNDLTHEIIGACIEVHRALGPGLLESVYEDCICHELGIRGMAFQRQVYVPITFKGLRVENALRLDLYIQDSVIIELKTVEALLPVHVAQILTDLKLTGCKVGLLMNYNVSVLKAGLNRYVHNFPELQETFRRQDQNDPDWEIGEENRRQFERSRHRY